jgi:hypothetical protein
MQYRRVLWLRKRVITREKLRRRGENDLEQEMRQLEWLWLLLDASARVEDFLGRESLQSGSHRFKSAIVSRSTGGQLSPFSPYEFRCHRRRHGAVGQSGPRCDPLTILDKPILLEGADLVFNGNHWMLVLEWPNFSADTARV